MKIECTTTEFLEIISGCKNENFTKEVLKKIKDEQFYALLKNLRKLV